MSSTIPKIQPGDRIRVMATIWAKEQGIGHELGGVLRIAEDGGCIVVLDCEDNIYRNIPPSQLMKV